MESASRLLAPVSMMLRCVLVLCVVSVSSDRALAAGTAVGTLIENTAIVDFVQGGAQQQVISNTVSFVVAERG